MGFTIAFLMSFFILPFGFYFAFSDILEDLDWQILLNYLSRSIFLIAVYGIFLFSYKHLTGKFIEIPFLTINLQDLGTLEEAKCIDRGGIFKLISTYNNGNLYGICLLMLLPLYMIIEGSFLKRSLVKLSLLLTLSRTVWFGLLFSESLRLFYMKKRSFKDWVAIPIAMGIEGGAIYLLNRLLENTNAFLIDSTMGGRDAQFATFQEFSFLPAKPFNGIAEIIYLGILDQLGLIGLLSFLVAILTPILLVIIQKLHSKIHQAILSGLITYLFLSISDGAILYIPTMAIFFFLSSLSQKSTFADDCLIIKKRSFSF